MKIYVDEKGDEMNYFEKRRSIRKYLPDDISTDIMNELLESARKAPSGNNTQPWHFIIVKDKKKKEELARASHNQSWMLTAPVFLVCIADPSVRINDKGYVALENSGEVDLKKVIRDTAIAVEHIVLRAEEFNLGTCWVAWLQQKDIRPLLNIPDDKYVVCILTIGYPDEKPKGRPRKQLSEFVHYEMWQAR